MNTDAYIILNGDWSEGSGRASCPAEFRTPEKATFLDQSIIKVRTGYGDDTSLTCELWARGAPRAVTYRRPEKVYPTLKKAKDVLLGDISEVAARLEAEIAERQAYLIRLSRFAAAVAAEDDTAAHF